MAARPRLPVSERLVTEDLRLLRPRELQEHVHHPLHIRRDCCFDFEMFAEMFPNANGTGLTSGSKLDLSC